jgi:hypothetical protein
MQRILTLGSLVILASALAFAETWTGKLLDASCMEQQKNAACTPTSSTSSFAIETSGKMLKLDTAGNQKAAQALKESANGADRSREPGAQSGQVTATVTGTPSRDEIRVESVVVH